MKDGDKTTEQWATEVTHLRQRIAELEAAETEHKRAKTKLQELEEKWHLLMENIPDIIISTARDGTIMALNRTISSITMEEAIGKSIYDYIPPEHYDTLRKSLERVCKTGQPGTYRILGTGPHGPGTAWYETSVIPIKRDNRVTNLTLISTDITERKRAEEALLRINKAVESSSDAIGMSYAQGYHFYHNKAFTKLFEYTPEELEAVGGGPAAYANKNVARKVFDTIMSGGSWSGEVEMVSKSGRKFPVLLRADAIKDESGKVIGLVGVHTDITERKRAEEGLRESEGKYRSLVESSDASIYLVDSNCNYLFINGRYLSRLGLKSSQAIGRAYREFHSPEETEDFSKKVKKVLKTGKSLSYEYRSQRDKRYFMRTLSPVKATEDGKTTAVTVISKEITELKQAEAALREREAFNFALFQYNPAETIVVDLEGQVVGFNLAKQNSGARLPAIGDAMYKDYAGKHEIDMRAELLECIKSDKIKEFPERKYGDKYLSITISPFSNGALIISEDITSRKQAEVLLQKERDTFYSILDKAPYGVVILGKDKRDIFINTEFTNITGYDLEDVPTLKDWFRMAYPAKRYRDMVTKIWEENVVQGEADKIFRKHFHKAFFQSFKVTCKDGTVKEIEFRPTKLDNGSTVVMLADITERKRMHELLEVAATEWRATFDAINDAVCLLDVEGRIKRCNIAMMRMIGRPFNEIADCLCWEALYGVSELPQSYPFERAQKSCHRESGVFLRDKRWFNISIDPLLNEEGKPMGFVHIMSDISERIMVEEQLQSSREQLRDLTAYLESVREQERTRIAREIHDELAQALTALRMDLSWLNKRLPRDQMPLVEKIKSMSGLINTTIQTVKRISAELRPGILDDLGLVAAIEWQIEEFQDRTRIASHLTVYPKDITVDKDRSTAIFRIFQETLTNVARHARATRVSVAIKEKAGKLTLRVSDNGKGIKEKQISDSKSFGILGMRERVHPWGGKISIKGTSEKGTTVVVTLPLARE